MTAEVGDTIRYVPHAMHALHKYPTGGGQMDYPWVIGLKSIRGDTVDELDSAQTDAFLAFVAQAADSSQQLKRVVLLRPRYTWQARIRRVSNDGSRYDLDVDVGNGFTLHEDGVPVDSARKSPHSCHHRTTSTEGP